MIFNCVFKHDWRYSERMKGRKNSTGRGGARKGAGRKKRVGWKHGTVSMPESAWAGLKRLADGRKERGEANASVAAIAGELIANSLDAQQRFGH
jgi:hypothetical protein